MLDPISQKFIAAPTSEAQTFEDDDENEDDSDRLRDDLFRVYRPTTRPHVPLWPDRFASSLYR